MCRFVLTVLLQLFVISSFAAEAETRRTISVSGDADVLVTPDSITLTLGVETSSPVLSQAKATNDENTTRIVEASIANGVARGNIKTDYLRIEPRYRDWPNQQFLGYWVQRNVVLELKDLTKFESVLSAVLLTGANYVHGIEFRTSELRKHRDKARSLAIAAAKEKAIALAAELQQTIGAPTSISETNSWWRSSYGSHWGSSGSQGMAQNVVSNVSSTAGEADSGSALEPGKIRVNANVSVTFELQTTGSLVFR